MWKATIRYEALDAMGNSIIAEEVIEGETVDSQTWGPDKDVLWIGSGKKTVLVPMRRLITVVKEQQ